MTRKIASRKNAAQSTNHRNLGRKSTGRRAKAKPTSSLRLACTNPASKAREVFCVARAPSKRARTTRAQATPARKVPTITISGHWLRAAGFAIGARCLVRAFARRQLVLYQL